MSDKEHIALSASPHQEGFQEFWQSGFDTIPEGVSVEQALVWYYMVPAMIFITNGDPKISKEELREEFIKQATQVYDALAGAYEEGADEDAGDIKPVNTRMI